VLHDAVEEDRVRNEDAYLDGHQDDVRNEDNGRGIPQVDPSYIEQHHLQDFQTWIEGDRQQRPAYFLREKDSDATLGSTQLHDDDTMSYHIGEDREGHSVKISWPMLLPGNPFAWRGECQLYSARYW
jgi:hypothetical protein